MPLDQGYLAQNVRRLAGMHLVSMETLARYVGISRPTLQAMVAQEAARRSFPRADTSLRIAEAFGVSLNALYSEPIECLREALDHLYDAPITAVVDPPTVELPVLKGGESSAPIKPLLTLAERRVKRSKMTSPPRNKGG
jgi:transcriptional regulator with XRE-family HTH domain